MMHCITHIVSPVYEHVDNNHTPMSKFQEESLIELDNILQGYISEVVASITRSDF